MTATPPPPASLWVETAPPGPSSATLDGAVRCDVAVVGAGYTGLHAALTFAKTGMDVVVLEAGEIGIGGSGRNGGVVSAKFRRGFAEIAESHGAEMARRMYTIAQNSVDHLIRTLDRHDLRDTGFARTGSLKCAHSQKALHHAWEDAKWLSAQFGDSGISLLSREEVAEETGSDGFTGGVLAQQGGTIQPLAYLRGLAGAARQAGVRVFEQSAVQRIEQSGDGYSLFCTNGQISAERVLLATNAYSSLTPATKALSQCLVPFRSAMIATDILPAALDAKLLVNDRSYSETRRMMRWFRKVQGRVLFGGRGALGPVDDPAAFRKLHRALLGIFPDLEGIAISHRWSGHVALTFDALPQAGMIAPRLGYAAGFNGAGVAMSGYVGHGLATQMLGHDFDLGLIERDGVQRVPFHAFRAIGVRSVTYGYEIMDALGL